MPGYDFVEDDTHPNDENGHGTHVTGTIAQRTNNGMGVAGAAFDCSIMPVRVLDKDGYGTYDAIVNGVDFAVENGAKVINMSLGSGQPSETLEHSLAHAHEMGVTLVAAAGNEFFWGSPTSYPAAYDAYCITVGAVRYDGKRAPYSNLGDYIDLSAPGGDLSVDQNGDNYADGVLQQAFMKDPEDFHAWSAVAEVTIVSGEGKPVPDAWVFGSWSGPVGWPDFAFTDMDGVATLYSGPIFGAGEVNFTVHSVSKAGWKYKSETTVPDVPDNPGNKPTSVDSQGKQPVVWGKLKDRDGELLPTSTEFYQNYPNPFNPDTWIPYQLAKDAEMVINIYSTAGRLVRTLDLGLKSAGFYVDRDTAAYWDGRDNNGEKVSSGVYFYSVRAGDFAATRKMVVVE